MYYLIRWLIRKLRRRTTPPAGAPVAEPGRDEPAVHVQGESFRDFGAGGGIRRDQARPGDLRPWSEQAFR